MAQDGGIGVINESLPELHAQLVQDPLVVDNLRISIIAFADSAEVILPLTKATDIADLPGLDRTTKRLRYGPVFRLLRETIERDVERMRGQGFYVYRPVVFFMTGGAPTDVDWMSEYDSLRKSVYWPHIISWGVGAADPDILQHIATPRMKAFTGGAEGVSAARALKQMMSSPGDSFPQPPDPADLPWAPYPSSATSSSRRPRLRVKDLR